MKLMESFRKIYDWVVHWSATQHARSALFCIAFAEASFFPVPPDVLLLAMGVSKPKKAFWFAGICLMGSVLGGLLGYWIGHVVWDGVSTYFYEFVPGFTPDRFEKVSEIFNQNAFWAIFAAGFTPIPYKIFTISAGVAEIDLWTFILASVVSRGARFFLVSGALYFLGARVKELIEKYFNLLTIVFTVLLVGGFMILKFAFS